MSLINDALKRAKQAHDQQTPPAMRGAPLHTAPPNAPQKTGVPPMLIVAILLFVAITGIAVFFFLRATPPPKPQMIASESQSVAQPPTAPESQTPVPVPVPRPVVAKPTPVQPGNTVPIPAPEPSPTPAIQLPRVTPAIPAVAMPDPTQPAVPLTPAPSPPPVVPAQTEVSAKPSIAPPTPASEPPMQIFPAVKLQGVLYSPTRPAAIINGRTLFVGERFNGITVIAISQSSATVTWNGMTNVLSMER